MASIFLVATLSLISLLNFSLDVQAVPLSDTLIRRSLSCNDNASDGTTYTTASHSYEIHCGTGYYGGDLSSTNTATFEDCLSSCDSATGCLAVAYVSGTCYLKSQVNSPTINSGVWGAKRVDAPAQTLSCVNKQSDGTTYQSGQRSYSIHCGADYYGGDLSSATTSTLDLCIAACDSTDGCIDVSYSGNNCFMKNKLNTLTKNGNVNTAVLTSAEPGASDPGPSTGPTCVNDQSNGQQYTATSGAIFDIICGVDYYGGDLTSLGADTFGSCIEACTANAQCVDVSYLGTTCYLKSVLNSPNTYSSVWTAKLHSANSVSTTSSSSTTPSGTTTVPPTTTTTPSSTSTIPPSTTTPSSTTTTTATTTSTTPSTTMSTIATTSSPSTTTTPSTPTTTTTTTTPAAQPTNFISNGEFDNGGSPWSWAANGNSGALSGSFQTNAQAYSGSSHAQLTEGTYGDTGTRSMCVSQYVYVPSAGSYSLSFYIGRISYPPPGSSISTDSITYSVVFDGVSIVSGGSVCGAYGDTCPLKALDGANRYQSVTLNLNGQVGYRKLSICGTYTTPRRGTEDAMLVDK
ncbi:hypothetical protein MMC10_009341, partial [Thelotrema lepadinum]|nr:hypothetical protein [Thelotrema lepadinum]